MCIVQTGKMCIGQTGKTCIVQTATHQSMKEEALRAASTQGSGRLRRPPPCVKSFMDGCVAVCTMHIFPVCTMHIFPVCTMHIFPVCTMHKAFWSSAGNLFSQKRCAAEFREKCRAQQFKRQDGAHKTKDFVFEKVWIVHWALGRQGRCALFRQGRCALCRQGRCALCRQPHTHP